MFLRSPPSCFGELQLDPGCGLPTSARDCSPRRARGALGCAMLRRRSLALPLALAFATLLGVAACASLLNPADRALTTSIDDAARRTQPAERVWVGNPTSLERAPHDGATYQLAPGFYRAALKSFCLRAGGRGRDAGTAYLPAPVKGRRAGLIYHVLAGYHESPALEQRDVQ